MHILQRLTVRNLNGLFSFFFCYILYGGIHLIQIYIHILFLYDVLSILVSFLFVRGRSSDILVFHIMWHRICSKGLNFNPRSKYGMDSPTTWKKFQNLKCNKKHGKKSTYCKIYIICLLTENKKQMHNYNAIYQIYLTEKCWYFTDIYQIYFTEKCWYFTAIYHIYFTEKCWFIHHYPYNNNWLWNSIGLE